MRSISIIEKAASDLVLNFGGRRAAVDVFNVAKNLNVKVKEHDLGENVSGVLYIEKGVGIIGYSTNQSEARKRFTIAHEIGHYILHRNKKELFVDHKQFKPVYRDKRSSTGEILEEREANAFAAALLMPKNRLIKILNETSFDLANDDEDVIGMLAEKFNVSTQAMAYRISNLNLF